MLRRSDILIIKYWFLTKGGVASTGRHVAALVTLFHDFNPPTPKVAPTTPFLPAGIKMGRFYCGTSGMSRYTLISLSNGIAFSL